MRDLFGNDTPDPVEKRDVKEVAGKVFHMLRDSKVIPAAFICKRLGIEKEEFDKALDFLRQDPYVTVERWANTRTKPPEVFVRITTRYPETGA